MVDLDEAKQHLRIDGADDDAWLALWIPAVSDAVLQWLKDPARAYVDPDAIPLKPKPMVKAAVLLELAQHYRFRDGKDAGAVPAHAGHGYILGAGATSLLSGLRKPTIA